MFFALFCFIGEEGCFNSISLELNERKENSTKLCRTASCCDAPDLKRKSASSMSRPGDRNLERNRGYHLQSIRYPQCAVTHCPFLESKISTFTFPVWLKALSLVGKKEKQVQ